MATAATTTTIVDTLSFDDTFYEFYNDLDIDVQEWDYLNSFYLNFEDDREHDHHKYFYDIPDYLSGCNSTFITVFFCELRNLYNPISFRDLQDLCILTHQMTIIHLHEKLWYNFLQVGKGQLKQSVQQLVENNSNLTIISFWPEIVTSIMISKGIIHPDNKQNQKNDQDIYINFIQNYLQQLEKQSKQRRLQYDTIVNRLHSDYTNGIIQDKIENYLRNESSLCAMRFHFERRIVLLEYTCMDRAYQLAYLQQKPNNLQLQIAKKVCSITYDKEKAEQELILFKFGDIYRILPKSLDLLEISVPTAITTLSDSVLRERLTTEFQGIIQKARFDLMHVLAVGAEAKKNDCQKIFDKEMKEIWKNQQQLTIPARLTPKMLTVIEERQKNIIACVKMIYHLKGNFYFKVGLKAMPVLN